MLVHYGLHPPRLFAVDPLKHVRTCLRVGRCFLDVILEQFAIFGSNHLQAFRFRGPGVCLRVVVCALGPRCRCRRPGHYCGVRLAGSSGTPRLPTLDQRIGNSVLSHGRLICQGYDFKLIGRSISAGSVYAGAPIVSPLQVWLNFSLALVSLAAAGKALQPISSSAKYFPNRTLEPKRWIRKFFMLF